MFNANKKTLYAMDLHDELQEGSNLFIMRVPGGWIYNYFNSENGEPICATFVPFHNEFQKVEGGNSNE